MKGNQKVAANLSEAQRLQKELDIVTRQRDVLVDLVQTMQTKIVLNAKEMGALLTDAQMRLNQAQGARGLPEPLPANGTPTDAPTPLSAPAG